MKDFRYIQAGIVISLKLNGLDNPSCPLCGHYNAMLHDTHDGPNKWTLKCRDCKARVHVERVETDMIVMDLNPRGKFDLSGRVKLVVMEDSEGLPVGTTFYDGVAVAYVSHYESTVAADAGGVGHACLIIQPEDRQQQICAASFLSWIGDCGENFPALVAEQGFEKAYDTEDNGEGHEWCAFIDEVQDILRKVKE